MIDLVNRSGIRLHRCDESMSDLVVGDDKLLLLRENAALLLVSGDNYLYTLLHIRLRCESSAVADRTERSLIHDIRKLGAGCSGRGLGDLVEIDVVRQLDLLGVNFEDFFSSFQIRKFYRDSPVKSSRTQQRGVQ